MRSNWLLPLCLAVLVTVLCLGLWPFHAPKNDVWWLEDRNGLKFGRNGTVFSSGRVVGDAAEASVEVWLQPRLIWDSGTFLAFYRSGGKPQLALRQSQTDLVVETGSRGFFVDEVFRQKRPVFLTVTSGAGGVCVYLDGVLFATRPGIPAFASELNGQLILGDSPGQTDTWSGQMFGVAIYRSALTAAEVRRHYLEWKENGRPESSGVALYPFDERGGLVVHNKSGSGVDLVIPARYQTIDKIFLEPFWDEFEMSRSYWSAAGKNIVGFLPFGFCFYGWFVALRWRRAALVTVLLGMATSVTIEVLQGFLPTRDSGTTDIITNTLGTWMGVWLYRWVIPGVIRFLPWLPFPAPPRR